MGTTMGFRSAVRDAASRYSSVSLALLFAAVVTCIYASTVMTTISGCAHEYCVDVGEFQVALPLWGTVHYTGYPLYMLLGSPFVAGLRLLGISPAMGASLYSTVWMVLAAVGLFLLIRRLSDSHWLAISIGLVFAVMEPVWVHGVLAEVYSLSMALSVAILYLVLGLRQKWSDRRGWLLAFLAGTGVAHHRLIGLMLVPVGLYLLPVALRSRRFLRWLVVAGLCFGGGFLPYLDIPLRIWLGSTWNYDQANTWQGFWRIFRGEEMMGLQRPSLALPALRSAARDIYRVLVSILTLPGGLLAALAAARAAWLRPTRSATCLTLGIAFGYALFTLFFRNAVLIQVSLMGVLLALCVVLAIGLGSLRPSLRASAGMACLAWAAWLVVVNRPFVTDLTRAPAGVLYASTVEGLEAPKDPLVVAPWGPDYYALAYAQRVEGRLALWEIVDHRADFGNLAARRQHRIYTHYNTLYVFGADWWAERIGSPLRITTAGPGMLMLTARSPGRASGRGVSLGDGIVLDRWEVRSLSRQEVNVVLYWTATRAPSASYSTFVHLSDADSISRPEDLIAQSDYSAPVYGWYPTLHWLPGEVIREDHLLQIPPERSPRTIIAGMYWQDSQGVFHQLGQVRLWYQGGAWALAPWVSP